MNLRTMTVGTGTGKDVKSTSQLKNGAKPTSGWSAKNKTTEYDNGGSLPPGTNGGKNTMK
jgi:hypothetical protein